MNPKAMPPRSAALFPVPAREGETPITGFPGDLQDVCTCGMGEAIEFERAWLASVASLNACAVEVYKNAFRYAPTLNTYFDTMTKAFASCMEMQCGWLDLLMPHAGRKVAKAQATPPPSLEDPPEDESEEAEDFIVETFENY